MRQMNDVAKFNFHFPVTQFKRTKFNINNNNKSDKVKQKPRKKYENKYMSRDKIRK